MIFEIGIFAFQRVKGGGRYLMPHDSTIGVGAGFYWFAAAVILFLVLGTLKAFWDDKNWRGRSFKIEEKKKKK
jgi:hypothetical protein